MTVRPVRPWSQSGSLDVGRVTFSCHCIGCCRRCGTCRTSPLHTTAYCDLLIRQRAERDALISEQKEGR